MDREKAATDTHAKSDQGKVVTVKLRDWLQQSRIAGALQALDKSDVSSNIRAGGDAQVLHGLVDPSAIEDPWARHLFLLAQGRTVREVQDHLYSEELKNGAWLADIGLLRGRFDQEVRKNLYLLIGQGALSLAPLVDSNKQFPYGSAQSAEPGYPTPV